MRTKLSNCGGSPIPGVKSRANSERRSVRSVGSMRRLSRAIQPAPRRRRPHELRRSALHYGRRNEARAAVAEAGQRIRKDFGNLDVKQRRKLIREFRIQLIPLRRPGRKRRKEITAAYATWKAGLCGLALYRVHITNFDRMSLWRRRGEARKLMDAIRSRERRQRD